MVMTMRGKSSGGGTCTCLSTQRGGSADCVNSYADGGGGVEADGGGGVGYSAATQKLARRALAEDDDAAHPVAVVASQQQ
eukprot:6204789-Pleurochrysis_carterae.AAC.2